MVLFDFLHEAGQETEIAFNRVSNASLMGRILHDCFSSNAFRRYAGFQFVPSSRRTRSSQRGSCQPHVSGRGAHDYDCVPSTWLFHSPAPRRGATLSTGWITWEKRISTHAPRGGCDLRQGADAAKRVISTHAPRGGCDSCRAVRTPPGRNLNPRTPRGVRPFQSF